MEATEAFLRTHNAGGTAFPWPKELFGRMVRERDGWFPVEIRALEEGSVAYPHVPLYTIRATREWAPLVTFLETLLTISCWYPSTVATLSRRCRDVIESAFEASVDPAAYSLVESRLHDFGFRACASLEQAIHGGAAHLLSFRGTDTLPAAYYTQQALNSGNPVAESIPASEHSVMMCYERDATAIRAMLEHFGGGAYSVVLDTFDYEEALRVDLPIVAAEATERGGFLIVRPDSGDPVEMTLLGLRALERTFGATVNGKGFKVITGAGIIFGDGINVPKIQAILAAVLAAGYSAQCLTFGMGSNLLHRIHRDTMSFATKVCHEERPDGSQRDLAKQPKGDSGKFSLPGKFNVVRDASDSITVFPAAEAPQSSEDLLSLVYDNGPVPHTRKSFDSLRTSLNDAWHRAPKTPQVLSAGLQEKIKNFKRT